MGEEARQEEPDEQAIRAADAEREAVVGQLQRHFADGRLTLDEFIERTGEAYAARTRADLDPLLADLPPAPAPRPAASDAPAGRGRRRIVAIMSGARRRGRWRVDRPVTAFAFWGGVKVDLRDAEILLERVQIRAWAIMGSVQVVVPEGVAVDLDGFVVMGGREDRTRPAPPTVGAPVIEVRAYGMWGSVMVRNPGSGEGRAQRDAIRAERRARHAERHAERRARHAERLDRARRRYDVPPASMASPAPPAGLPRPSLEGILPPLPEPADALLRQLGLIGAVAADPAPTPDPPAPAAPAAGPAPVPQPAPAPGSGPPSPPSPPGAAGAPDPGPAVRPRGTVTILFTDIAGSTEMAEQLGDHRWVEVLQAHNALVRSQVTAHEGTEVKVHGDGFMVAFASARSAVLAAIDVQRELATYRAAHPDVPVEVRIGIHTGEVVDTDSDYLGRNVILAARLADRARGGEILVSSLVKQLTDSTGDLDFEPGEEVELKGLSRPWSVHRVTWR